MKKWKDNNPMPSDEIKMILQKLWRDSKVNRSSGAFLVDLALASIGEVILKSKMLHSDWCNRDADEAGCNCGVRMYNLAIETIADLFGKEK